MERSTTPSLNKWLLGGLIGLGLGGWICGVTHAQQSLIWPTPEIHGTVRDLTHLPALPLVEMDPTNLQHQMWSQPGSAMTPQHYGYSPDDPIPSMANQPRAFSDLGPSGLTPKQFQMGVGAIKDIQKWFRERNP